MRDAPLSPEFFTKHGLNVSRETVEKLSIFKNLVKKWQKAVNLIAPSTVDDINVRHMLDSAQLWPLVAGQKIIDLGSGAGFPGMVLAIMGAPVTLVESDQRKAVFLSTVSRETQTPVTVLNKRIAEVSGVTADVVTARALAPLSDLLFHVKHLGLTRGVFLKGENLADEISAAQKNHAFEMQTQKSLSDPRGQIVTVLCT